MHILILFDVKLTSTHQSWRCTRKLPLSPSLGSAHPGCVATMFVEEAQTGRSSESAPGAAYITSALGLHGWASATCVGWHLDSDLRVRVGLPIALRGFAAFLVRPSKHQAWDWLPLGTGRRRVCSGAA